MGKEECSKCGKEFEAQAMFESLNSDEFTCRMCMQKLEDAGKVAKNGVYMDIDDTPSPHDLLDNEEG
jgi:hypothetical protein